MRYLEVRKAFVEQNDISEFVYEMKYGNVRADIVAKSGNDFITYEIKSEGDSFARLKDQITLYKEFSNRIFVVVSSYKYISIRKWLEKYGFNYVGIIIYFENQDNFVFKKMKTTKRISVKIDRRRALLNIPRNFITSFDSKLQGISQREISELISDAKTKKIWNKYLKNKMA